MTSEALSKSNSLPMKRFFLFFRFISLVCLLGMFQAFSVAETVKPNFITIFCDDLGYAEIGPFSSKKHRTSNIDRMAAEGC